MFIDSVRVHAWLQLVRPPNLLTVIGDPVAGAVLAFSVGVNGSIIAAIFVPVVSLCLYVAGLIMNDYADMAEDGRERPERPLPSGIISPRTAIIGALCIACVGIGIAFCINSITGITAILLLITIVLYDFILKQEAFIGAIIMGVCRGLSFLLGAFAVNFKIGIHSSIIICIAFAIIFYIASVTSIAVNETEENYIGGKRWLPALAVLLLLFLLNPFGGHLDWLILIPGVVAVWMTIKTANMLVDVPETSVVQAAIGIFIRILLLLQATICFKLFPYGVIVGILLMALWPVGGKLAKKFYAS